MEKTFYELDKQTILKYNVFENQEETEDEIELLIEIVNDSDLYIIIENYIDVINEIAETDSNFSKFLTNRMNEQDIINLEKAVYQKRIRN